MDFKIGKKGIKFLVFFTILFSIFALNLSKNKKDFIYVIPKIKNFEVLNKSIGNYSIKSLDLSITPKEIKKTKVFNGGIFYNVPNGKYQISGSYLKSYDKIILEKDSDWEKIYLNLEGIRFTQNEEKFLIFLTICFIAFNTILYIKIKNRIPKKNSLNIMFFLITLKMCLCFRLYTENNVLIFLDFFITRVILIIMIFYFLKNIFPKKLIDRRIIYLILFSIYFYNIIIGLIIYSPQFLVYLVDEHYEFITFIAFLRRCIDFSRVLFFLFLITFFHYRKNLKRKNILSWTVVWITFFIFEFFREIFPNSENLSYFIEVLEIFGIYWALVFYNYKVYSRNVLKVILYTIAIAISYILLFQLKSVIESALILGIVVVLHFYSIVIDRIMYIENKTIDQIYNHLCLVTNIEEFQKVLENEIKKQVNLKKIYVKILLNRKEFFQFINEKTDLKLIPKNFLKLTEYDYAYRVGFNKNEEIALIFVKENDEKLTFGEQIFIMDLSTKISSIINKLRLETLYKELE